VCCWVRALKEDDYVKERLRGSIERMKNELRSTGAFLIVFKVTCYVLGAVGSILALFNLEVTKLEYFIHLYTCTCTHRQLEACPPSFSPLLPLSLSGPFSTFCTCRTVLICVRVIEIMLKSMAAGLGHCDDCWALRSGNYQFIRSNRGVCQGTREKLPH
jgi:hypothetical protein